MTETHDTLADSALDATKSLHELLRLVSLARPLSNDEIQRMKALNKTANNAVAAMRRHHKEAAQVRRDALFYISEYEREKARRLAAESELRHRALLAEAPPAGR